MKKSFWVLILLSIIIVLFSVQNASAVEFSFLSWTSNVSLAVLLIITFILGVLVGALYSALARRNKKSENIAGDAAFDEKDNNKEE